MNSIEIKLSNNDELINTLEKISRHFKNHTPLMRALSGTMYSAVMQNFDAGGRPAWLGLRYRVGKPLNNTGALRGSISQEYSNDEAIVGTNSIYAAIHNFGGVITPKRAKSLFIPLPRGGGRRVKKVTIPKREFLTLTAQDQQDLLDDAQQYFQKLVE